MIRFLLIALTLTSSAPALDVAVQAGIGEFKNKLSTSYRSVQIEHDFNQQGFVVGRYQSVDISDNEDDPHHDIDSFELHQFSETMGGLGVHVTSNLDAYFLVDDTTYYGAIRSQADIAKGWIVAAKISHRNWWKGGLKRTQAGVGLGYRVSDKLTATIDYETGNFRSDYVSDRLLIGAKFRY